MRRLVHPDWQVVGILGDPTLSQPRLDGAILTLPVADTYEALPSKVYAGFTWLATKLPNAAGIFKTDDDIIFQDKAAIHRQIMDNQHLPYWGIRVGSCDAGAIAEKRIEERFTDITLRPHHQAAHYGFGHGYWLSREVLPLIIAAEAEYRESFLEDVCTGAVLNAAGIIPLRLYLPYIEHPRTPEYLHTR